MKKYYILVVFLSLFFNLQSQAQLKWGYKAGINNSGNLVTTNFNFSNRFGINFGIFAESDLGKGFYFQPTAQLDFIGYGIEKSSYTSLGLSLNPNFLYKFNDFQIGLGPKFTAFLSSTPYPVPSDGKTGFGGNIILGYTVNEKISIQLSYSQNAQNYQYLKRYSVGLSLLGYFGKKEESLKK